MTLNSLPKKALHALSRVSHVFFETFIGQKLLILLAPFVLLPNETESARPTFAKLFKRLHVPYLAPGIGGFFFSSAFTVLMRALKRAELPLSEFLDFDSFDTLWNLTLLGTLLAYGAALSYFLVPRLLNLLWRAEPPLKTASLMFWTLRYGGFLMFFGVTVWGITSIVMMRPKPLTLFFMLIWQCLFVYLVRQELRRQQERFSREIPKALRLPHLVLALILLGLGCTVTFLLFLRLGL